MKMHTKRYMADFGRFRTFKDASFVILPFPYEGGVSYGKGTAGGPDAVLDASAYMETYDEVLGFEPYRAGIVTVKPPAIPQSPSGMIASMEKSCASLLACDKFVIVIGGDHSITTGYYRALHKKYGQVSVIQFDAHADLRDSFLGSTYSHACTMARIRELTGNTLQIGIRSMSPDEAALIKDNHIALHTMHRIRTNKFNLTRALAKLPDPVFITLDVDVFDLSVVASTGTPEPGGLGWHEMLQMLQTIFMSKKVIGFDVVELSYAKHDHNSPYAIAKLIYKMIGFKVASQVQDSSVRRLPMP